MKKAPDNFCHIFLKSKNVDDILSFYDKNYIYYGNKEYVNIREQLRKAEDTWMEGTWQYVLWKLFDGIMEVCCEGTEDIEKRKVIVNTMYYFLEEVKNEVKDCSRREDAEKFRDSALTLLLNVICAFSSNESKFRYSALLYDMVQRLNNVASFREFYGNGAEECILNRAMNILYRFHISKEDVRKLCNNEQKFVERFGNLVLKGWKDSCKKRNIAFWCMVLFIIGAFVLGKMSGYEGSKEKEQRLRAQMEKKEEDYEDLKEQFNRLQEEKDDLKNQLQEKESEIEALIQKQRLGVGEEAEGNIP